MTTIEYTLLDIPGTELTDACTNCGGAHHIQQCGELRAALTDDGADATIDHLLAIIGAETPIAAFSLTDTWRAEKQGYMEHVAELQAELDKAHTHIGALVASNREMRAAMRDYEMDVDEEPPFAHREMMAQAYTTITAARTWLRREAK